jgi:hypothetical protein
VAVTVTTVSLGLTVGVFYAVTSAFSGGDDDAPKSAGSNNEGPIVVQAAAMGAQPVGHVRAEPEADRFDLVLSAPPEVEADKEATFEVGWFGDENQAVTGELDLQRIEGRDWETVGAVAVEAGKGSLAIEVPSAGLYRVAYGGSSDLSAVESSAIAVLAGEKLDSRLTATVELDDDENAVVTAGWTTESTLPIVGELELQVRKDDKWETVSTVETNKKGLAEAEVESDTAKYRFRYPGGSRFAKIASDSAVLVGDDVQTIPVSECSTSGEIDGLDRGAACHYTPVSVGNFVVAHDYLGNAWWNTMDMGTHVELSGKQAGIYEVVDRVMAPGRGAALGSASNWACGDDCDVILQTCRGDNTGFTWLRRVSDGTDS